jgi:hypothetical protein
MYNINMCVCLINKYKEYIYAHSNMFILECKHTWNSAKSIKDMSCKFQCCFG